MNKNLLRSLYLSASLLGSVLCTSAEDAVEKREEVVSANEDLENKDKTELEVGLKSDMNFAYVLTDKNNSGLRAYSKRSKFYTQLSHSFLKFFLEFKFALNSASANLLDQIEISNFYTSAELPYFALKAGRFNPQKEVVSDVYRVSCLDNDIFGIAHAYSIVNPTHSVGFELKATTNDRSGQDAYEYALFVSSSVSSDSIAGKGYKSPLSLGFRATDSVNDTFSFDVGAFFMTVFAEKNKPNLYNLNLAMTVGYESLVYLYAGYVNNLKSGKKDLSSYIAVLSFDTSVKSCEGMFVNLGWRGDDIVKKSMDNTLMASLGYAVNKSLKVALQYHYLIQGKKRSAKGSSPYAVGIRVDTNAAYNSAV